MSREKRCADVLTASRVFLALAVVWCGYEGGRRALPLVMGTLLVAWTTDTLDGYLARRAADRERTWIGDHDATVDQILCLGVLIYLALAGYVQPVVAWAYFVVAGFTMIVFRSCFDSLMKAFTTPILVAMVWMALREAPPWGWAAVVWCVAALALNWGRFSDLVAQFFAGFRRVEGQTQENGARRPNHAA